MNAPTLIILLVIAVLLFFAVRHMLHSRKKGSACASCSGSESCAAYGSNCPSAQNSGHS